MFIKNGRAVVKMFHHRNQAKNFLHTALDYLSVGLIPDSQPYVDEDVMKAAEYTLAEKFFIIEGRKESLRLFYDEIIEPEQKDDTDLYRYYTTLRKLEEEGFFTRIYIRDLSELGELVHTGINTLAIEETKNYTKHMDLLANRKRGEEIDIDFKGKFIKSAIVFIARPEVFFEHGVEPYLNHIFKRYAQGYKNIYLFAGGTKVPIAENVTREIEKQGKLIKITEKYFSTIGTDGTRIKRIYIVFKRP